MNAKLCGLGIGIALLGWLSAAPAGAIQVVNTNDSGTGSLRQAVLDANAAPGSSITFAIPGSGVHVITLTTGQLEIDHSMTIDGYTQTGASPNTLAVGNNAVILIEIDAGNASSIFNIIGGSSLIQGLSMVNSSIAIASNSAGNVIRGNFVGVDHTGNVASRGYLQIEAANNTIGGAAPSARNVIAGNNIFLDIALAPGTIVQGNYFGLNAAGTTALTGPSIGISVGPGSAGSVVGGSIAGAGNVIGNWGTNAIQIVTDGVVVQGNLIGTDATGTHMLNTNGGQIGINVALPAAASAIIGGSVAAAGNTISSAHGSGIFLQGAADSTTTILGNRIGTDVTGILPFPNSQSGVCIQSGLATIGGINAGEGNRIAFNQTNGVNVSGTGYAIRGNSFEGNAGLGIALSSRCDLKSNPTPNDDGDGDTGPNNLQNYPIVTSVTYGASTTRVQGQFNSAPNTTYALDFYENPACSNRPQEFLQGKIYRGSDHVTTDASGNGVIDTVLNVAVENGARMAMTATDPLGNTSEFSQRILFSSSPSSGPSSGGTTLTLNGMLFGDPATVTIGGVAATNVSTSGTTTIFADAPALAPGTVNDIVADVPGGLSGTLRFGYVSDFLDVPGSLPVHPFVTKLVSNAITAGCGGGDYCPASPVTRGQMAVFLLRGLNGLCYTPPPATGTVFNDVPIGSFAAAYIEALAAAHVTSGCGGGNYCPTTPVTRAQMAVFLLRSAYGPTYTPPTCTNATFADVPCSSGFAPWIYDLVARGITVGCGGGNYCPSSSVTRGQMAVFLVTTFGLP